MKKILPSIFLLTSTMVTAQTNLSYVKTQGDLLILSINQAKAHLLPSCVVNETSMQWAINIKTDEGRAALVLVTTAVSTDLSINIESAGDCAGNSGIERIKNIALTIPSE